MTKFRVTRKFDAYISYSTVIEAPDPNTACDIAERNDDLEWSEPDYQQFDDYEVEVDEET